MILTTWTFSIHADWCLFHQINTLTSPPNHFHSQGHCQSSPWYKGQRKETFAASSLVFLCCVFCQNKALKLFHTQPAKGVKLHLYWHWFQYQPPTLPGASFWITSKSSKQTLKAQNTSTISKTGVINFLYYLRMPVHVLSGQSNVLVNPINPVILFIFNFWYFIILIFKCDLNPSRI